MDYENVIEQVASLVCRNRELEAKLESIEHTSVLVDKFYNVAMTTEMVARLHSVSEALVRKYIKLGMIETHPMSTDAKLLVRASDALTLDFRMMKFSARERNNK